MLLNSQKIEEYKQYSYKGSLSYYEGRGYLDINHPWFMCFIEYRGDAVITPNTNSIKMSCKHLPGKLCLKQFPMNNPKENIFEYFGSLEIIRGFVYGIGGRLGFLHIKSPNFDQPELMATKPEDITRFPEKISEGFSFNTKDSLMILSELRQPGSKIANKGRGKTTTPQSRTSSGGSTY